MNNTAPKYKIHSDGLGTFLSIANSAINQWQLNGQMTEADIHNIQEAMQNTMFNMGAAFELLAMERIDYTQVDDNAALCGALMMAGRAMVEMAAVNDSLQSARLRLERAKKPAEPHGFPPPDGV